jgi:hypothetical protein
MKTAVFAACASFAFGADPFPAAQGGTWEWVPIEGSKCMSGKETGVYVRYSKNGNKNLGIYFYGGGACFNTLTCTVASTTDPHPGNMGTAGIFASRQDNPLDDYNWITVPYCTGDVHAGDNEMNIAGHRDFSGLNNVKLMLERAVETFKDVETLFVTGESAGGFGSLATYDHVRSAFPAARGVLMDDSGQIIDDEGLAVCLQQKWRQDWQLNKGLPADCACNNDNGNLAAVWPYLREKYPNDSFSLISSVDDAVISTFFAFGLDNCHALLPVGWTKMHASLERLAQSGVNIYMIPGSGHTHTSHSEFYTRKVQDIAMNDWIAQLIDASQPDPSTVRPTAEDVMVEAMSQRFNATRPYPGIVV